MSRIQQFLEAHESYLLSLQFPMLLAIATIFCIFLLFKWLQFSSKKKNLPPSPPKLPIVGNLHQIGLNPHRSLRALSQRYGPLMLLRLGKVHVLVISSADTAREIMRTHDLTFANRPKLSVFEKLLYGCKDMATSPYGEHWKQIRSLCVIHLLSNKRVQSFHGIRFEETSLMIDKIKKLSSSSLPINLSEIFVKLANDITCRVALGKKYSEGEEGSNFKELLKNFVELLGGFNVSDYIPWLAWVSYLNGLDAKLEKVAKGFDDLLEGVIAEHEERMIKRQRDSHAEDCEDYQDFVDVLLRLQNEKTLGFSFDREFMKAAILDMFAAGTDTSFTILEWGMSELLRHPEIMKKLQNEVRGIAGEKLDVREEDLENMHYLKAVIAETLRLHTPLPLLLPRESTKDVEINGYDIPACTQVIINAWAIARDPMSWDEPEEFLPERFLNNSIDFKGQDFRFIPFGAGRRSCPGIQFGMNVVELVLANLINKFDWSLPSGMMSEEDLDMTEIFGLATHRKHPLTAIANCILNLSNDAVRMLL